MKELYKLCGEYEFTIVGVVDFHDEGDEDEFDVDIGVAGVEIECRPKDEPEFEKPQHPTFNFLINKDDGKWQKGSIGYL